MSDTKEGPKTITIKENDFIIKYSSGNYILFIPTKNNKWKIEGYYTQIESALRKVYLIRKSPKYKLGESAEEARDIYIKYKELNKKVKMLGISIFKPIKKLEEKLFGTNMH